jgi:type IV pilus assembly protein PilC
MPYFRYKAATAEGKRVRGQLYALNDVDVELRLKRMGLTLIRLWNKRGQGGNPWRGRASRRDLISFCFHMQHLARAGVPLLQGLHDLLYSTPPSHFRDVLSLVADDLEGGKLLSQALAAHPETFDAVFVNLVRAAESSDQLAYVFSRLEVRLKAQDELEADFSRLLIYPATVAIAVFAAAWVLLFYLTPKLAVLVHSLNLPVPTITRWLLALLQWLRPEQLWLLLTLPAAAFGLYWLLRANPAFLDWRDRMLVRLPVLGEAIRKSALARFSGLLALLTQSGLTILDALAACEPSVGNRHLARKLASAGQRIAAGGSVSESFQALDLFPPSVIRMLHTGEKSGTLADALENTAWFFERDARDTISRSLKLLEPGLALLLGAMLAFLLLAVFLPIYQLIGELRL